MNDSFDNATSFDSRWKDDGLGWHGRQGAEGKSFDGAAESKPAWQELGETLKRYVEGYACGYVCAGGSRSR